MSNNRKRCVFTEIVCTECGKRISVAEIDNYIYTTLIKGKRYSQCSYSCNNKFKKRTMSKAEIKEQEKIKRELMGDWS